MSKTAKTSEFDERMVPATYKVGDRTKKTDGCDIAYISDIPTHFPGCDIVVLPQSSPHKMSRPMVVRLTWHRNPPRSIEEAKEWGWWPRERPNPTANCPHFAIDAEGRIAQFLDPGRQGSLLNNQNCSDKRFLPHHTVVMTQLGSKDNGTQEATEAQQVAAQALVTTLTKIFRPPLVIRDKQWLKA